MKENYGRKNKDAEGKVKEVFNQLQLDREYLQYEERIVAQLRQDTEGIDESRGFRKQVLTAFLDKIYKRNK